MLDEDFTCFYNHNFLMSTELKDENVLDYFSLSQFYDKSCVNEILKMQSQFANLDMKDKITSTIGIHYTVIESFKDLFIIAKREFDGNTLRIIKIYYCMHGHIYVAPTTRGISEARTIDGLWHINKALDSYEDKKKFNWLTGFEFGKDEEVKEENATEMKFILDILNEFEQEKIKKTL